jgi:hypothetical protein
MLFVLIKLTNGQPQIMKEEIKFRQQAEDEHYSTDKKSFLVSLPPNSTITVLFFAALILTLLSGLYFLRVPVKLAAQGTVDTGFELFTIKNNWNDAVAKRISVKVGDFINYDEPLFELSREHDDALVNSIRSFIEQKKILSERNSLIDSELSRSKLKHEVHINKKMSVIRSIDAQLKMAELRETEIHSQFKKGLTSKDKYVFAREKTASYKTTLAIEKSNISSFEDNFESSIFSLLNEKNSIQQMLTEVEIKTSNNPLSKTIASPCACIVTNVIAKLDRPILDGEELIWLQVDTKKDIQVTVRIPSNRYKPVKKGDLVYVTAPAFPALRFGKLKGIVGDAAFKSSSENSSDAYFVIKISVENVPNDITLTTGMSIEAEFILDTPRLYEFIVN